MPDNCKHWHGLLAEQMLAPPSVDNGGETAISADLAEHLVGCTDCQALAAEFRSTVGAISQVDAPSRSPAPSPTPGGLTTRIANRLADERRRTHRRRRYLAVGTAAAAALLIVVSTLALRHHGSTNSPGDKVVLSGSGIRGDATLRARAWGTEIHLSGTGFTPGQQYNVWLERADGTHIPAGTFTGVRNASITGVLASAMPSSEAMAIGISKPDGSVVVRAPLN